MPGAQRQLACDSSSKAKQAVTVPPSTSSDGGEVKQVEGEGKIQCFFAVLDPAKTAKLKGSKYSACLNGFPDVNRLREHLWRAHSPTHNCRVCRKNMTKPTPEFKQEHAHCRAVAPPKARPELISTVQAEALQNLNQHFKKPNDEVVRCEKLFKALFPNDKFEKERFMSSHNTAGTNGSKTNPKSAHTSSSPKQKNQRQPQTSAAVHRPQNANPPASPPASERPVVRPRDDIDVSPKFPTVPKPRGTDFSTKPHTLSGGSRDSGIGTELSNFDDFSSPEGKRSGTPERHGSPGHEGGNATELMGIQLRLDKPIPKAGYPQRVLEEQEGTDIDMEDVSAPAVQDHFPMNVHLAQHSLSSSSSYDSRSEYSDGTSSQHDTDMDRSVRGYNSDSDVEMPTIKSPNDVLNAIHRHVLNSGPDGDDYGSFHDLSESGSEAGWDS